MVDNFEKMADYLLLDPMMVSDKELQDGLKWVDMQARKEGLTYYEMVFKILETYEANKRAREWLSKR